MKAGEGQLAAGKDDFGSDPQDRQDLLEPIDIHFGRFLERLGGSPDPGLFLAAAFVSRSVGEGNICLNLPDFAGRPLPDFTGKSVQRCPDLPAWRRMLEASPLVGKPGDYRPLILDGQSRLYLYRYWEYEADLARFLIGKVAGTTSWRKSLREAKIDPRILREGLDRLFPLPAGCGEKTEPDRQRIAAFTAVVRELTVISGSPGTGKTATVARAIMLLLELFRGRRLRIALTAPTGKAAARLQEVMAKARDEWCPDLQIRDAMPQQAQTIHRLLGSLPHSPYFRHRRGNPLSVDVVVVDEASMVDLPLLAKLVQALPDHARLILVGDRNQLASVEAGAVLSDICGGESLDRVAQDFSDFIGETDGGEPAVSPGPEGPGKIADCLIELRTNYRFPEQSGIHRLSLCVNRGEGRAALAILKDEAGGDAGWMTLPAPRDLPQRLKQPVINHFNKCLDLIDSVEEYQKLFDLYDRSRILCALRRGPYGAAEINALCERILREAGLIRNSPWYPGRPVMITKNDYGLGLFNGDVGLILPDPERRGEMGAFFPEKDGRVRRFAPVRLPEHETVHALTVHKSQGSEFASVLLILPDRDSPVLTRELIYTAITRAKTRVEIWGNEEIFRRAVARRNERSSGLRDALWPRETGIGAIGSDSP
ncbi:MAG: exodeoxyribonuclease V subunit alpha [Proteobacteria bacterium]|nr:exodeoxyribonuclease V subunit alpha [Pseudomonadota bacterium]